MRKLLIAAAAQRSGKRVRDRDRLEQHRLQGTVDLVRGVPRHFGDGLDDPQAGDHLAEDRMAAVEVGGWSQGDEELPARARAGRGPRDVSSPCTANPVSSSMRFACAFTADGGQREDCLYSRRSASTLGPSGPS